MGETYIDCEARCSFFKALSPYLQLLNRWARLATRNGEEIPASTHDGKEIPASLNTLCGLCMRKQINDYSLEEKKKELLRCEKIS